MLDPIGISEFNYTKSKGFYAAALAPLACTVVMQFGGEAAGRDAGGKTDFRLSHRASVAPA